jgi:single-strand DNA-binding protein
MASLNKVMIIGNLTRDPELRHTPKGTAVTEIGLAINRIWKDDEGRKQEETTFVDVTLWGRQAEVAAEYLAKGRPVYVEARLETQTWDDKETGKKRSKLALVGETLQFLGSGTRNPATASARPPASVSATADHLDQQEPPDDDIPF